MRVALRKYVISGALLAIIGAILLVWIARGGGTGGGGIRAVLSGQRPHSVDLNWAPSSSPNVTGYFVYRRSLSDYNWVKMNTTEVSSTTYKDTTVLSGAALAYRITAVSSTDGEGVPSDEVRVNIPSP
jgi:hypothetical protein